MNLRLGIKNKIITYLLKIKFKFKNDVDPSIILPKIQTTV